MKTHSRKCVHALIAALFAAAIPSVSMAATTAAPTAPQADSGKSIAAANHGFNVRVNPLSMVLGIVGAELDVGVSDRITVGPTLGYWSSSFGDSKFTAFNIGARGNFYLTGHAFSDSWFVGPFASYSPFSVSSTVGTESATGTVSSFSFGSYLGYQWVWSNGFNLNLALGAQYVTLGATAAVTTSSGKSTAVETPSIHGTLPAFEFSLGYAL